MPGGHVIVLVGIPGSGKSTYAARLLARCPQLRVVSPDGIREQLYPGYEEGRIDVRCMDDRHVFRLAYRAVTKALARGENILFDATSLTLSRRKKLITLAHRHEATVSARYFAVTLETALRRNRHRRRQVPPGVIVRMANLLVPPQKSEGFDRVVVYQ